MAAYLGVHDLAPPAIRYHGDIGRVTTLVMRPSMLFNNEYLVAFVETDWFRRVSRTCDAIASPVLAPKGAYRKPPPPLVFVPDNRRRSRGLTYRAVLEHEFVHVNQAILGVFPTWSAGRRAEDLQRDFWAQTTAEFEACMIQLAHWPLPGLVPREFDLSLEHWCVLRGYSQALEECLAAASEDRLPPAEMARFLDMIRADLPLRFRRLAVAARLAAWFADRFVDHVVVALDNLRASSPQLKDHESFRAAARWVRDRS